MKQLGQVGGETTIAGELKAKDFGDVRYRNGEMVGTAKEVENVSLFGDGENKGYYYVFSYAGSGLQFAGDKSKESGKWVAPDAEHNELFLGADPETARKQHLHVKVGDEERSYSFSRITFEPKTIATKRKITKK